MSALEFGFEFETIVCETAVVASFEGLFVSLFATLFVDCGIAVVGFGPLRTLDSANGPYHSSHLKATAQVLGSPKKYFRRLK